MEKEMMNRTEKSVEYRIEPCERGWITDNNAVEVKRAKAAMAPIPDPRRKEENRGNV